MEKTVDFFEFRKDLQELEYNINKKLHDKAFTDDKFIRDYITLTYPTFFKDRTIREIRVNWGAIGATTPEKAKAYGEALSEAAEAAGNYKYIGYTVTYKED